MRVRASARRHGVADDDSLYAAGAPAFVADLDDDHPQRLFMLGFDSHARLLELVLLIWDDGTEEIIHSMPARKQYRRLLG